MKVCPNCKMTVDAESECPFCYTTLTYEPVSNSVNEKYVFNQYFVLYLVKQSWFSILCLIIVLIRMLCIKTEFNPFCVIPFLSVGISLLFSFFQREITKYMQWKYSEEYSSFRVAIAKIATGMLAVLFSFVIH